MGEVTIVYRYPYLFDHHDTVDITCADVPDWKNDLFSPKPDAQSKGRTQPLVVIVIDKRKKK